MTTSIKNHSHQPDAAHLSEQSSQLHHTQQAFKSQKTQRVRMQRTKMQRSMLAAKFFLNKKWAHHHGLPARGALSQKISARFGAKPERPGQGGKPAGPRGRDKELREKEPLRGQDAVHEHEREKEREKERERPHDRDPQQQPGEREKEREKEKDRQRQPSGEGRQKDPEPEQQQQSPQGNEHRQSSGNGDQQQQRQQPQQHQQREGKGERGPAAFAVTRKKVSTAMTVPENFQVLGAKLKDAPPAERNRVLLHTFAKVVLRHAAQLENGLAIAPLMVLNATSPAAMRRVAARMQSHIAGATFAQNRHAASGAAPARGSATVSILSHSLDLAMALQRLSAAYSIDDQSIMSVRQIMIDAKAAMPALAASNGVRTGSENPPEVRVAPVAPGAGT
jgi:hypothetical protein